jgi:hypothetical protein
MIDALLAAKGKAIEFIYFFITLYRREKEKKVASILPVSRGPAHVRDGQGVSIIIVFPSDTGKYSADRRKA